MSGLPALAVSGVKTCPRSTSIPGTRQKLTLKRGPFIFTVVKIHSTSLVVMPVRRLRSIVDLTDLVTRGDIIFLDIDETLVHPEFDASEPWAVALKDAFIEGGVDETVAWTVAVEMWQAMQSKCDVSAPEGEDTSKVLMNLKASGHVFVGLTARGPEMAIQTRDQLARCGLGDIFQPVSLGELPTEAHAGPEVSRVSPLTHLDGIVYCSGSRKPAGLLAFEHAAALTDGGAGVMSPQVRRQLGQHARVLLVDDRESHCVAVGRVIEQLGRPYLCAADSRSPDLCVLSLGSHLPSRSATPRYWDRDPPPQRPALHESLRQ